MTDNSKSKGHGDNYVEFYGFSPGFLWIAALRKGKKFNADYFISEILAQLAEWPAGQVEATDRKLIVHFDNARPHTAKNINEFLANNGITMGPHPPCSPDITLCDFFLFGYTNNQLMGRSFDDADQLLIAIKEVCESIEKAVLERIFHEWREKPVKSLMSGGGLVKNT
jgi:hypothetical protein